jgi:phosphoribosylformylglycinamidine synthase subunit PurL
MGARPIGLLNSLRFGPIDPGAETDADAATRNRYLLGGVVAGIAGYGNCIGIPDVGGEVTFDPSYSGNPLVNAMCVGLARHEAITLARAAGPGNRLLLVGATTGRDGIQGASFASATLDEGSEGRRPAVQVGNPFLEKLLMEACLELSAGDAVVAMQDLGAAGLTCALAELTARGGVGAAVDLDAVPRREDGMTPYEVLLSESQERMLIVVPPHRVAEVRAVFDRYELAAADIGEIVDEPVIRARSGSQSVCVVPGRALADDAPRYEIHGTAPAVPPDDLEDLARQPVSADRLLSLLGSPNARDRRPIWRRYDHMNGTNTIVGPGRGDAAVLRVKGTSRALALAIDGPSPARIGALDPYLAGLSAVLEGAVNVACAGAEPIGITDCLNFGSPESDLGAWQLERSIDGIGDACRALGIPVVSGNVSLYNETPDGPILPTPVVGTIGLVADRSTLPALGWHEGDEIWLIGEPGDDAAALAGSELAWGVGRRGGRPTLDVAPVVGVVRALIALRGTVRSAHDASVGGIGVALARMAVAGEVGARIEVPTDRPTAALHGERAGRVLVGVEPAGVSALRAALDRLGVAGRPIGYAGGRDLELRAGGATVRLSVTRLATAWRTPFTARD